MACAALVALASTAGAVNVKIINNSGRPASDVHLLLENGSSSDGQLPNGVSKQLDTISNGVFSLSSITAGRLYISYDTPASSAEPPHSPIRYDKVEFTYPGVANLTAVDFFSIPFDMQAVDSSGAVVGQALTYRCNTSTIVPRLRQVGAAAEVSDPGRFVRFLAPQLAPADAYASMSDYIHSLVGQTITVNDGYYGSPFQTISYSGTVQPDGSITLNGTLTTPPSTTGVPGATVAISGASLAEGIYTGNTSYTVNGATKFVTDPTPYSNVYRDIVAGFSLGYWGGKYGNDSANWLGQPDFAAARTSQAPFVAYNQYAATIADYSYAYGYSFHDVGPSAVTVPFNSSVDTLQVTINPDTGPNAPGCDGSSTPASPSTPSTPSTPSVEPAPRGKATVTINTGTAKLDGRGRALLTLGCGGDPCKGELTLTYTWPVTKRKRSGGKTKDAVVGRAVFAVPEGKSQRIWVPVTRDGQTAIKRARKHQITVLAAAALGSASKATSAARRNLRLRAYTPPKRKRR